MVEEQVAAPAPASARGAAAPQLAGTPVLSLAEIEGHDAPRWSTCIPELDRVLGGGLVPGALVLVGGDPGIGKSTLLLQAACALAAAGRRVLYITGEESPAQVKMRAARLELMPDNFFLCPAVELASIQTALAQVRPQVMVVDSIQTVRDDQVPSAAGSVVQIRAVTQQLVEWGKRQQVAIFIVGHVTKEGAIAGPRVMEHMVDTVLYLEGERTGAYRILRAHKNRFGSAQEMAVFEMESLGLMAVANPSAFFLAQRAEGPGAVVVTSLEGSRPLLVEVQALVTPAGMGGTPRRTTTGFDPQRTAMLCAVLGARAGIELSGSDVFVNVAGGARVIEPAVDLGVAMALASAARQRPVSAAWVAIGEIGLAGEVRSASRLALRLAEAKALGFTDAVVPARGLPAAAEAAGLRLRPAADLAAALSAAGIETRRRDAGRRG